jgi:hypothetical protein
VVGSVSFIEVENSSQSQPELHRFLWIVRELDRVGAIEGHAARQLACGRDEGA